jgi:ATP adenylyltransferase
MDYLWTPWRSTYMEAKKEPGRCIFCEAAGDPAADESNLVVFRAQHCFVILNRFPYTSGHLMIVPYEHVPKLSGMSRNAAIELMDVARRTEEILESSYRPDGLNIGMNVGAAAGAGIAEHTHLHMLPRWSGDANFMTTVAHVRIIPEALEDTYRKLSRAFAQRA